jgi:hypothetical protein
VEAGPTDGVSPAAAFGAVRTATAVANAAKVTLSLLRRNIMVFRIRRGSDSRPVVVIRRRAARELWPSGSLRRLFVQSIVPAFP